MPNIVEHAKVTFCDMDTTDTIGGVPKSLMLQIAKIYIGYRQCYCANPNFDEVLQVVYGEDGWEQTPLGQKVLIREEPPNSTDIGTSGYRYMCEFIANHMEHESPLEHGVVTVQISDLSRAAAMQHNRHRIQSLSQTSQRYIKVEDPTVYMPRPVDRYPAAKQVYLDAIDQIISAVGKLRAMGIPEEDIRYLYPNAYCTSSIVSMNFRAWIHYFEERCCTHAQREIRYVADSVLACFRKLIPYIFDRRGAKCVRLGYCPENSRSCGRYPPKAYFEHLR